MSREARLIEVDKIVLGSIFIGDIIQFSQEYEKDVIDFVFANENKLRCLSTDVITEINMNTLPSYRVQHEDKWTCYAEVLEKWQKIHSAAVAAKNCEQKLDKPSCFFENYSFIKIPFDKMDSDRMEAKLLLYIRL